MLLTRAPLTTLARTGVVARTEPGPGCQAGRRAKPAHVRADLAQDSVRRGGLAPGHSVARLALRQERLDAQAHLRVELGHLPLQQLNALEGQRAQASMGLRALPCESSLEFWQRTPPAPERPKG